MRMLRLLVVCALTVPVLSSGAAQAGNTRLTADRAAPAVLTFLTESTHNTMAPAFYVVAAAAVSLVALARIPRSDAE